MSIEIDDAAFQRAFADRMRRLAKNTEADLERAGEAMAKLMQSRVPARTGRLRRYIGSEKGRDARGPFVRVGVLDRRGFYGRFVEYGTSRAAARPFIRPVMTAASRLLRFRGWR